MDYIDFGRVLTQASAGLAVITFVFAVLSVMRRDRRMLLASRMAMILGGVVVTGAAAILVAAFLNGAYELEYVFGYSERKLSTVYKISGLWAGLQGSILFWSMLLGMIGSVLAWSFRKRGLDPSGRRLEPYVYAVYAAVQLFFLLVVVFVESPFDPMGADMLGHLASQGLLTNGIPADGSGLNPQLENYWMLIHPPSVYLGFIIYTVPFAFGMAALIAGEFSSYWIRTTRRWTVIGWLFNTNGVVLGGLWAYETLGWGGYWAWDPVENASFLPWLTGTAFLHSVMIQERRDMLRVWNSFLIAATFVMTIFGTYLTRSGIVSSVHAFASGTIGHWFLGFLIVLIAASFFFVFFRMRELRSPSTIDSLMSREAIFLLNNMVLIAITGAIVVLTLWPKISHEFLGQAISVNVPVYNFVCTPLFALLLFLTAIGPGMGWVRTAPKTVVRNLLVPAIFAIPLAAATQYLAYEVIRGGAQDDPRTWMEHLYPTFVVTWLGYFIVTALAWEVFRTVRAVTAKGGRTWLAVFLRLVTLNNRRYGGYVVHAGLAMLAIGVVGSSMYRVTREVRVPNGESARFGPYDMSFEELYRDREVSSYYSTRVKVTVKEDGVEVATLEPEKRRYPATGFRASPTDITWPSIARRPGEDLYLYFDRAADGGALYFTVFRNPLISFVWLGWLVMIAGGVWAALPLARRRVGLAG